MEGADGKECVQYRNAFTVECTLARTHKLKYERFASFVSLSSLAAYESICVLVALLFQQTLEITAGCHGLCEATVMGLAIILTALVPSAFIPEKLQSKWLFSVEEIKFLRELVRVQRAYQYSKEHAVKSRNETSF